MKIPFRALTAIDVAGATGRMRMLVETYIKLAKMFEKDPRKRDRYQDALCPVCFYKDGRIGGHAMTTASCGICKKEMLFGSTNVDKLCSVCARKHRLCKNCGADIDLNAGRKSFRFVRETDEDES